MGPSKGRVQPGARSRRGQRGQPNRTHPRADSGDPGTFRRKPTRRWWTPTVLFTMAIGVLALAVLIGMAVNADGRGAAADAGAPRGVPTGSGPSDRPPESDRDTPAKPAEQGSESPKRTGSAEPKQQRPSTRKERMETIKIPADRPKRYQLATVNRKPKSDRGQTISFNVRVQKGLPYEANQVSRFIHTVLNDRRSWGRSGEWRIKLVGAGTRADIKVFLATPQTTNDLCAPLQTRGKVSCRNGDKVVLNARRWAYGTKSYGNDLIGYRINLVNHEFGHALGHGHVQCPGKGKRAPVMMQQTKGLHGCTANPWPHPDRAKHSKKG